jgi:ABC-type antimicrobial peptide transport system permease subunit
MADTFDPTAPSGGAVEPSGAANADYEVGLESLNQWQLAWRKFKKHRLALIGLGILAAFAIVAIIGPIFFPYAFDKTPVPDQIVYKGRPPSLAHPFGETAPIGR